MDGWVGTRVDKEVDGCPDAGMVGSQIHLEVLLCGSPRQRSLPEDHDSEGHAHSGLFLCASSVIQARAPPALRPLHMPAVLASWPLGEGEATPTLQEQPSHGHHHRESGRGPWPWCSQLMALLLLTTGAARSPGNPHTDHRVPWPERPQSMTLGFEEPRAHGRRKGTASTWAAVDRVWPLLPSPPASYRPGPSLAAHPGPGRDTQCSATSGKKNQLAASSPRPLQLRERRSVGRL